MSKRKRTVKEKRIIALAYIHREGWIVAAMICSVIWPERLILILAVSFIAFSVWSFVGYNNRWKHIYCSHQNACHQEMTPNHIQWHKMKENDAYGVPLIFFILGLVSLVIMIFY